MIYLDHAATSWPKPPEVLRAMREFLESAGGNPGRSGHRLSVAAGRVLYELREALAGLFGAGDPLRVIFTLNATCAINLALRGLLRPGDAVLTSSIEHNAVMRPLRALERQGVRVDIVPCSREGRLDPAAVAEAITPETRLVVLTHASNVMGTILPVADVARVAHRAGAMVLVDAAQTAGVVPIDMEAMGIDLLAFTGHKGLQGPPGTGGLVIADAVDVARLEPIVCGGTGSRSEFDEQPEHLPDKYEAGTPNGVGLAGLLAGVRWVRARTVEAIRRRQMELTGRLIERLRAIPGVHVYGPCEPAERTAVVSFTAEGVDLAQMALDLDERFGVLCRVGLHCAPAAHKTIGTFPQGTVRFALGAGTSSSDIEAAATAVRKIATQ